MSGDSSEEKTEPASDKKLKKAREKGNVVTSKETVSSLLTAVALCYLFARRDAIAADFARLYVTEADTALPFALQLRARVDMAVSILLRTLLPFVGLVLVVGIGTGLAISGFVFSGHPLIPDVNKVNPAGGFKKIFGRRAMMTFLMHFIRVTALVSVFTAMFWFAMPALVESPPCGLACQMPTLWRILLPILVAIVALMLAFALFDYAVQKAEFMREQKMSITEVKREHKDSEGDPHLRGQLRSERKGMVERPGGLNRATVVIHAGTRRALAIRYIEGDTPAPLVVAKSSTASGVRRMLRRTSALAVDDRTLIDMIGRKSPGDYINEDAHIERLVPYLQKAGMQA